MRGRQYTMHEHAVALSNYFQKRRYWAWSQIMDRAHRGAEVGPPLQMYTRAYLTCDRAVKQLDWLLGLIDDGPKKEERG